MYQSLQACRAAAAALVVLFHLGGTFAQDKYFGFKALDGPFAWADAGVDFFFVLSGFLITLAHRKDFGQPRALGPYLFKRGLRIYPTYWLICIAVTLASLAVPSLRQSLPDDALTFIKALALLPQDPTLVGGTGSPILFVAWSLQYEMLFYAVIAAFIADRRIGAVVVALLGFVFLGCHFGVACGFPRSFLSSKLILLFVMGVATAYVLTSQFRLPQPLLVGMAGVIGFFSFGAFEVWAGRDGLAMDRRLIYGAFSTLIILALAQAERSAELVVRGRWSKLLGDSSYSLYLLHIPIISVLCKLALHLGLSNRPSQVVAFVVVFLTCVGAALVFHLGIERPMLALFRTKSAPAAPTAQAPGKLDRRLDNV